MSAERRLAELDLELPDGMAPAGAYVPAVRTGSLLFLSGHGPIRHDGSPVRGKVGTDLDLEAAIDAARLTGLNLLAAMRRELGTLDAVSRVVKVLGMVNAAEGFTRMPEVIDGCSNLLVEVFGEAGRHARSAIGMASLPFNIPVEIELIAEVRPTP